MTYQLAWKRSNGLPSRMPVADGRCAATVPAFTVPAAISTSWVATEISPPPSTASIGNPMASASTDSDGPKEWAM